MHVHHTLIAEEVVAPDALQQLRPAVDDAGSAGQLAQQVEFQRREVDGCPALDDPATRQVDAQRRRVDDPACAIRERADDGATAPQHGLDPGHKLAGAERLGQVVIGAELKAHNTVGFLTLGREHEDIDIGLLAQPAADLQAVHARQH